MTDKLRPGSIRRIREVVDWSLTFAMPAGMRLVRTLPEKRKA